MSWMRKVRVKVDLAEFERAMLEAGRKIETYRCPCGIPEECELVVDNVVGVRGGEVLYDSDFYRVYQDVMKDYLEYRLQGMGYCVEVEKTPQVVVMRVQ